MDKLLQLSFSELEALRTYHLHLLNDDSPKRPGVKEVNEGYYKMICEVIDRKFEELIIVEDPRPSSSTKAYSIPAKKTRL